MSECRCKACTAADAAEARRTLTRHRAIHVWYEMSSAVCQTLDTGLDIGKAVGLHHAALMALGVHPNEVDAVLACIDRKES